MITAKEARQEYNKTNKRVMPKKEQKEREKVERKIRRAIKRGRNEVGFLCLYDSTIKWLKSLNYKVTSEFYDDMVDWWVVRW